MLCGALNAGVSAPYWWDADPIMVSLDGSFRVCTTGIGEESTPCDNDAKTPQAQSL